jgi:hypothetical protein
MGIAFQLLPFMPIIKWPDKENKNILNVDADKNCVSVAVYFLFMYLYIYSCSTTM